MGRSDEEFYRVGSTIASELTDLASLRPNESVLDIGAGYGVWHMLSGGTVTERDTPGWTSSENKYGGAQSR
jgi:cyclopropane fatty-acyl-phospholipid synthase-like methyltransferase